jgi:hypothetical protein
MHTPVIGRHFLYKVISLSIAPSLKDKIKHNPVLTVISFPINIGILSYCFSSHHDIIYKPKHTVFQVTEDEGESRCQQKNT